MDRDIDWVRVDNEVEDWGSHGVILVWGLGVRGGLGEWWCCWRGAGGCGLSAVVIRGRDCVGGSGGFWRRRGDLKRERRVVDILGGALHSHTRAGARSRDVRSRIFVAEVAHFL